MNEVLMPRDEKALAFVDQFGLASMSQLAATIYASGRASEAVARRRLRVLTAHRQLNRLRIGPNGEYIYFRGKRPPDRREHHLLLVDVYVGLLRLGGQIERWEREPDWGNLRPDAYVIFWFNGKRIHIAVEVQRDTNAFDQAKYEQDLVLQKKATKKRFQSYPKVLVVSEKPFTLASSEIKYVVVPTNLDGLNKIL